MNKALQKELETKIDAFAHEVSDLIRRAMLTAVTDALDAAPTSTGARATGGRRKAGKRPTARGKRTPDQVEAMATKVLREIKKKGGRRIEEIADAMGVPSQDLKLPVKKLVEAKKVKTAGQRRGTKYSAR